LSPRATRQSHFVPRRPAGTGVSAFRRNHPARASCAAHDRRCVPVTHSEGTSSAGHFLHFAMLDRDFFPGCMQPGARTAQIVGRPVTVHWHIPCGVFHARTRAVTGVSSQIFETRPERRLSVQHGFRGTTPRAEASSRPVTLSILQLHRSCNLTWGSLASLPGSTRTVASDRPLPVTGDACRDRGRPLGQQHICLRRPMGRFAASAPTGSRGTVRFSLFDAAVVCSGVRAR